jgi:hypothetical protein
VFGEQKKLMKNQSRRKIIVVDRDASFVAKGADFVNDPWYIILT